MLYGEPATARFLVAVQRLKRQQQQKERLTRIAKHAPCLGAPQSARMLMPGFT